MHFYSDIPLRRTISALIELGFSDRKKKTDRILSSVARRGGGTVSHLILHNMFDGKAADEFSSTCRGFRIVEIVYRAR